MLACFPKTRKIAAGLALLGLWLQVLLPVFMPPAMAQQAGSPNPIRLCSAAFKPVSPGPAGKAPVKQAPSCPVCQALHYAGHHFLPPKAVVYSSPAERVVLTFRILQERATGPPDISAAPPRAPPVFA